MVASAARAHKETKRRGKMDTRKVSNYMAEEDRAQRRWLLYRIIYHLAPENALCFDHCGEHMNTRKGHHKHTGAAAEAAPEKENEKEESSILKEKC